MADYYDKSSSSYATGFSPISTLRIGLDAALLGFRLSIFTCNRIVYESVKTLLVAWRRGITLTRVEAGSISGRSKTVGAETEDRLVYLLNTYLQQFVSHPLLISELTYLSTYYFYRDPLKRAIWKSSLRSTRTVTVIYYALVRRLVGR